MKSNTQQSGGVRGSRSQPPRYKTQYKHIKKEVHKMYYKKTDQVPHFLRGGNRGGQKSRQWNLWLVRYSKVYKLFHPLITPLKN